MTDLITMAEMRRVLAEAVERAGGVRAFARKAGLESHAPISLMLAGKREVSEAVANALGHFAETAFRPFRKAATAGAPMSTLETYKQMLGM